MPTNDYRLRATVTYTVEYDEDNTIWAARESARLDRDYLERGYSPGGCTTVEPTRTVKVEVVR